MDTVSNTNCLLILFLVNIDEIIQGFQNTLRVVFTRDEVLMMTNFMDEDKSGDITLNEFQNKLSLNNLHENSHKYLLSETKFIESILVVWYEYRSAQIKEVIEKVKHFDKNGDGIIEFAEFETIVDSFEKNV